jgi:hypothetical protein
MPSNAGCNPIDWYYALLWRSDGLQYAPFFGYNGDVVDPRIAFRPALAGLREVAVEGFIKV